MQEDLRGVATLACTPLRVEDVALSSGKHAELHARILELKVHRANDFHHLLLVEAPQGYSVSSSDFERARLENHEQRP